MDEDSGFVGDNGAAAAQKSNIEIGFTPVLITLMTGFMGDLLRALMGVFSPHNSSSEPIEPIELVFATCLTFFGDNGCFPPVSFISPVVTSLPRVLLLVSAGLRTGLALRPIGLDTADAVCSRRAGRFSLSFSDSTSKVTFFLMVEGFGAVVRVEPVVARPRVDFVWFLDLSSFAATSCVSVVAASVSFLGLALVFGRSSWVGQGVERSISRRRLAPVCAFSTVASAATESTIFFGLPRVLACSGFGFRAGAEFASSCSCSSSAWALRLVVLALLSAAALAAGVMILVVFAMDLVSSVAFVRARVTRFGGDSSMSAVFFLFAVVERATMGILCTVGQNQRQLTLIIISKEVRTVWVPVKVKRSSDLRGWFVVTTSERGIASTKFIGSALAKVTSLNLQPQDMQALNALDEFLYFFYNM